MDSYSDVVPPQVDELPTKTSEDWHDELHLNVEIIDPDGWDRENFYQSWYKEEITKVEFYRRMYHSTLKYL
jgi:hypothetical protein